MKVLPVLCALLFAGAAQSATRYVDPAHSKSVNSGAGAATAPYKTISHAMRQLASGDRLVIKAGTYRETMNLKVGASNLVIEGSPGTVIKGSDIVTGWVSAGSGRFVRRNWTVNSQQVFVNGVSFQQIGGTITSQHPANKWPGRIAGGVSSMTPNSFYYDAGGRNLYVKPADGNLSGKTVEASVRTRLGEGVGLNNVQLKNLAFMHSNTSATTRGAALRLDGTRLLVDHISVTRTDYNGLAVIGDHNVVSNSGVNYNGQLGMSARGRYVKLINNETSYNNTRGFWPGWESGGIKCIGPGGTSPGGLKDSLVKGHKALYNGGNGIWLDNNPGGGNQILDSVSAYNEGHGIHFEISSGVQIYNNLVFGNKRRGIFLPNSSNALVAHNLSANNGWEAIAVMNERKASSKNRPHWMPKNNHFIGNIVGWAGSEALRLPDKSFGNTAKGNLYVDEKTSKFAQERTGQWAVRVTGLPSWKSTSGQDSDSWEKIFVAGLISVSTMSAQQAGVDWSNLKNLAAQYKAPPTALDNGLPPGPVTYPGTTTPNPTTPTTPSNATPSCTQTPVNVSAAGSDGGFAYIVIGSFGTPADNSNNLTRSALRLFENGLELKPAHAAHVDIRTLGQGRFSHWSLTTGSGESLRFSASNSTDPKTNGRSYSYCVQATTTTPTTPTTTPTTPTTPTPTPTTPTTPTSPTPTPTTPTSPTPTTPTSPTPTTPTPTTPAATPTLALKAYFVAPGGSDSAAGTQAAPFATLQKAHNVAVAGDTIYVRGGTYNVTKTTLTKDGSSGNRINLFAYPGEIPILDGAGITAEFDPIIFLNSANWWHIKGFELRNNPQLGGIFLDNSSNNIIENNNSHHHGGGSENGGMGILVNDGTSANNLFLNNDCHHNRNLTDGNADGMVIRSKGAGNVIRGNRFYYNSDDGLDTYNSSNVIVDSNWAWRNGYAAGDVLTAGNGNGFKFSGDIVPNGGHTITNNVSWRNKDDGFIGYNTSMVNTFYNNTGWDNGSSAFDFQNASIAHVFRNNLAYDEMQMHANHDDTFNSWSLPVTVNSADFVSLSFSCATGPRQADGSLPNCSFLQLVSGSDLIDKGVSVGLPFSGTAPDLGAGGR